MPQLQKEAIRSQAIETRNEPANLTPPSCSPQYPCNRFRVCDRCAARRQARWADIAERIEAAYGPLDFAVITPNRNDHDAIVAAKRAALRAIDTPAAIWSVETGILAGRLHINIIGRNLDINRTRNAAVHVEPIRNSARSATAYAFKRKGMPHPSQYDGRIAGGAGHLMEFLARARAYSVAQAASMLTILSTARHERMKDGQPPEAVAAALRKIADQVTQAFDSIENHTRSQHGGKGNRLE